MKMTWLLLLAIQLSGLSRVRSLYQHAAEVKQDAAQLDQLMIVVDTSTAIPVMVCYKGANEMIQAKYAVNPVVKLGRFKRGKELITKAFNKDTSNLEVRFIRYAIQRNLPAFLNYHDDIAADKRFLLNYTVASQDTELKVMINNYLKLSKN